ncbi:hypothetical protein SK128_006774, partial [Halocaridina rubra]
PPEEADPCSGDPITCAETQLKMDILMGVRDQDLVQHLISLNAPTTLNIFVTCCRSFKAARTTASVIHALPNQLRAVSAYKNEQRWQKTASSQQTPPTQSSSSFSCQSCDCQHGPGRCSAADGTYTNCGHKGYWTRTSKCPAKGVQCHNCNKTGHGGRCCRKKVKGQGSSSDS